MVAAGVTGLATSPDATLVVNAEAALAAARTRLAELRRFCKDSHPAVLAELQRIQQLERRLQKPATPAGELAWARERLAELRRTCKDGHPAVQAQLKLIAELERKAAGSPVLP